jgi:hypothetical protein
MRFTLIASAAWLLLLAAAPSAHAVWLDDTAHYIRRGYHRNEVWPWPFVCPDRVAVREPFCMMIDNGWRRQNLLGPHHFQPETNKLTVAGELRVRWIMTQAPPNRRSIFVERSLEPEITAERIAVARDYAAQVALEGQVPQVFDTHLQSEGRPASVVDGTNVRFYESLPPPMLPPTTLTTGGSGQ